MSKRLRETPLVNGTRNKGCPRASTAPTRLPQLITEGQNRSIQWIYKRLQHNYGNCELNIWFCLVVPQTVVEPRWQKHPSSKRCSSYSFHIHHYLFSFKAGNLTPQLNHSLSSLMSTDLATQQVISRDHTSNPRRDLRTLLNREVFWRDHQKWLAEKGYMLRPRLRPEWTPSWGPNDDCFDFEDGYGNDVCKLNSHCSRCTDFFFQNPSLTDATRMSDNSLVMLKHIDLNVHPHEVEIGLYLSSEPLASHPRNHCAPIYEVMDIPNIDNEVIIVMPLLREFDNPRIKSIGEAVEFFRQVFEVRVMCHVIYPHLKKKATRGYSLCISVASRIGRWCLWQH